MQLPVLAWQRFTRWLTRRAASAEKLESVDSPPVAEWPVHSKVLLNKAEQRLYRLLRKSFPRHIVFSQVALSQLIGLNPGAAWSLRNRYSQLVADFVICDYAYQPLAVVELDGRTHDHPKQVEADARKVAVLNAAHLDLVRLNAASLPTEQELKALFSEHVHRGGAPTYSHPWARRRPYARRPDAT
jgi:hypothetical protein